MRVKCGEFNSGVSNDAIREFLSINRLFLRYRIVRIPKKSANPIRVNGVKCLR